MDPLFSMPPILKWPGGKRRLTPHICGHLPKSFGRYYEPFAGGAALFFNLLPKNSVLGDLNPDLVNVYVQLRNHHHDVQTSLAKWKNTEHWYYKVRDLEPKTGVEQAARTIYLCALSFNGIYRVNLAGKFNVPYGYKTHIDPLMYISDPRIPAVLKSSEFRTGDFETTTADATENDLVYFDPPYTLAHNNNGFVKYNEKLFSWEDQERLALHAKKLFDSGCHVVISNAEHASVSALYKGFKHVKIPRHSIIAASPSSRKHINESLFVGVHDA